MIKFSEASKVTRFIISAGAIVTALSVVSAAAAWAADTVFWSEVQQQQYEEKVADAQKAQDIRELKRQIMKLQLEVKAGKASPEDKAYLEFLKQDLENLQ